jgi:hypothetical protein
MALPANEGQGEGMDTTRLVIELEDGVGPIAGWLHADEAGAKPFSGYMELIAALEAARIAPPPGHPADDPGAED